MSDTIDLLPTARRVIFDTFNMYGYNGLKEDDLINYFLKLRTDREDFYKINKSLKDVFGKATNHFTGIVQDLAFMSDMELYDLSDYYDKVGINQDSQLPDKEPDNPIILSNKTATPAYAKLLGKITPEMAAKDPRGVLPAVFEKLVADEKLDLSKEELVKIFAPLSEKIIQNDDQADSLHRTINAVLAQNEINEKTSKDIANQVLIYHLAFPDKSLPELEKYLTDLLPKNLETTAKELSKEVFDHEEARIAEPNPEERSAKKLIEKINSSELPGDQFVMDTFITPKNYDFDTTLDSLRKENDKLAKDISKLVGSKKTIKEHQKELEELYKQKREVEKSLKATRTRATQFKNIKDSETNKGTKTPLNNEIKAQLVAHGLSLSEANSVTNYLIENNLHLAHGYLSSFLNRDKDSYAGAKAAFFSDVLDLVKDKFPNLASKLKGFKLNVEKFDKAFQSITYFKNVIDNPGAMLQIFSQKIIQDFSKRILEKYAVPAITKVLGNEAVNLAIKQAMKKFVASNVGKAALKLLSKEAAKRITEVALAELPGVNLIVGEIVGWVVGKFADFVSWASQKIKKSTEYAVAVAAMLIAFGLSFFTSIGVGGVAAAGIGGYVGARVMGGFGRVLTGNPSAGMVQGANRINYVITTMIVETAKDSFLTIFLVVLATPIVIAFILLIITSSAYVVPQEIFPPGTLGCWPMKGKISQDPCALQCGDCTHQSGLDMNAFDLAADIGTPIYAPHNGIVLAVLYMGTQSYGDHVILKSNEGFYTLYGHMSTIYVSEGQTIRIGEQLGLSGNTGYSTGPHLHWELRNENAYTSEGQCDLATKVPPGWKFEIPYSTNEYANSCFANQQ